MILKRDPKDLIGKPYDKINYHCYDFVSECLNMPNLQGVAVDVAKQNMDEYKPFFIELLHPVDNCVVVMGETHIGIYKDGGVYHNDRNMVKHESFRIIRRKYNKIEFYDKDIEL